MNEEPPYTPPGCLFLMWIAVAYVLASAAGIILQKFCPFLFQ